MIDRTNDPLASRNPLPRERFEGLALDSTLTALKVAIVELPGGARENAIAPSSTRRRPRRLRPALAFAAAALLAAVVSIGLLDQIPGGETQNAWAVEDIAYANSTPLMLLQTPGWRVEYADDYGRGDGGELKFSDGRQEATLSWRPVRLHKRFVEDRAHSAVKREADAEVGNSRAVVFRYPLAPDDPRAEGIRSDPLRGFGALWSDDRFSIEFGGAVGGVDTEAQRRNFLGLLADVRAVSPDSFLSAMPPSVVLPGNFNATAEQMLSDVPQPAGFDYRPLISGLALSDRYQFGAKVVGGAGCAWIDEWLAAERTGDRRRGARAIAALSTYRQWSEGKEMSRQGAYWPMFGYYAEAMRNGGVLPDTDGRLTIEGTYRTALGCR